MTASVKSLVRKSVRTVWGGLGSTSNPTLSQLSAKERDAKSFKEERRAFRSMKEREEPQTQDGVSRMPVGSRSADGSIQKPGETVPGVKTQEAVFTYSSGIYVQFPFGTSRLKLE